MILSTSQLEIWRRCKTKYFWAYQDHVDLPRSIGRIRGEAGHLALAHWYRGSSKSTAIQKGIDSFQQQADVAHIPIQTTIKQADTLAQLLERYMDWAEPQDEWRGNVASVEERLEHPLFKLAKEQHTLVGILDLVFRTSDAIWLVDHKFVKDTRHEHLLLDAQMTTYFLLYWLTTGTHLTGAIYNSVLVGHPGKPPAVRSRVTRTPAGLQLAWRELIRQGKQAVRARQAWAKGRGQQYVYRTPTTDCHWDCDFYEGCLALEATGSQEAAQKVFTQQNQPGNGLEIVVD